MRTALSYAGSDPTSGAGIQLDLKVFSRLGVTGLTVPNSITAQNTRNVKSIFPLPLKIIKAQLDCIAEDFKIDAAKTGMIYTPEAVEIFVDFVLRNNIRHLVVDPVIVSSTGKPLMKKRTIEMLKNLLLPHAELITPNIYEAEVLSGVNISNELTLLEAMKRLVHGDTTNVVITGGDVKGQWVFDYYYDGQRMYRFRSKKIKGEYHGTGCCFSAALTAFLAGGTDPLTSVRKARRFVQGAIRRATKVSNKGLQLLRV